MKLFEITAAYQSFVDAVENGEIPEDAIADTLESITATLEEKADNTACVIKNMTAEIFALKAEERKLAERRRIKENQVERLREYLANALIQSEHTKIETARNKISFRKSEGVKIDDESAFIEWAMKNNDEYLTYKEPAINKTAIKGALADGKEVKGAYIEQKQNLQIG